MPAGRNTEVKRGERVFHVQTQPAERDGLAVETLVFEGGAILVRMTASLAHLTEQWQLRGDDLEHVVDLQHWDLVRKIQHGMLDGHEPPVAPVPAPARAERPAPTRLADCNDPAVRDLLSELEQHLSESLRKRER
ncbi:MAG TPA: hypothetical protein VJS92_12725 [Candidatus Polarisedimenticolaceae bacterium]|nr:hypothetical protein [Candidatus Polarisedimenticolaceae bacterium]